MKVLLSLALAAVAAGLAGCSGISSPSNNSTETFSGAVTVETGSSTLPITHSFAVNRTGEMSARLTAITPNSAALVGLALGQQVSGTCSVFSINNLTGLNRDVFITPIQKGNFCIQVFNGGGLNAPQNYTLQVNHP